ncbi:hypothetical protein Tco_0602078 [Tanacetum coccineum]
MVYARLIDTSDTRRIRAFEQETRGLDVEIKRKKKPEANYGVTTPQELHPDNKKKEENVRTVLVWGKPSGFVMAFD